MSDSVDLEKTQPIILLESRRKALIVWLADGQTQIKINESENTRHKQQAIEMLAEIDEIEAALKVLQKIPRQESDV